MISLLYTIIFAQGIISERQFIPFMIHTKLFFDFVSEKEQ